MADRISNQIGTATRLSVARQQRDRVREQAVNATVDTRPEGSRSGTRSSNIESLQDIERHYSDLGQESHAKDAREAADEIRRAGTDAEARDIFADFNRGDKTESPSGEVEDTQLDVDVTLHQGDPVSDEETERILERLMRDPFGMGIFDSVPNEGGIDEGGLDGADEQETYSSIDSDEGPSDDNQDSGPRVDDGGRRDDSDRNSDAGGNADGELD